MARAAATALVDEDGAALERDFRNECTNSTDKETHDHSTKNWHNSSLSELTESKCTEVVHQS